MDYIHELGPLAIASRMKNMSDLLMRDMALIYRKHHVDFNPRWFTFLHLIHTKGPLTITTIARSLSQTHPASNQVANALEAREYVASKHDRHDHRKRVISLTEKGEALIRDLTPLWTAVESAVKQLLSSSSPGFLKEMDKVEQHLGTIPMSDRIAGQLRSHFAEQLQIIPYRPDLRQRFKALNLVWLNEFFSVEPEDERILENPESEIINLGGTVIFACLGEITAGTGALLHRDQNTAEITKMAVDPRYRGYGIGRRILNHLVEIAQQKEYEKIILLTSENLPAAVSLYRSAGFYPPPHSPGIESRLRRKSILMEKILVTTNNHTET